MSPSVGGAGALLLGALSSSGGGGALLLGAESFPLVLGRLESELSVSPSVGGVGALLIGATSSFGDEGANVLGVCSSRGLALLVSIVVGKMLV